ncbi:MAG: alpha amylase C-terminal domain-containing protein [Planctomycetes bacterium]|nr:alpha amylase C-terminal domain-containing protein [Planctomycetota bacterium]
MKNTPQIVVNDLYLRPFEGAISHRIDLTEKTRQKLVKKNSSLVEFASGHEYFGLHKDKDGWVFREWAPNATAIYFIGMHSDWQRKEEFKCVALEEGVWELKMPLATLKHNDLYRLNMIWEGGEGDRIPAWCQRVVQSEDDHSFSAQVWDCEEYKWKNNDKKPGKTNPMIYEAHVGMSQEEGAVGTYQQFQEHVLPRIADAGYDTVQLMAIQEHPYYGSFGYHVSSLFAPSSRFGTPEELKELIDTAHGMGIRVIMDLVHSHAVKNEVEGISRFDGTLYQFFHDGPKGDHMAWDSRCYNYGKAEVLHFLLSNCRYWIEEFRFDGFRMDGITSMTYFDHGLERSFCDYDSYFNGGQDDEALAYLSLANELIHTLDPRAITIAEDMSGMPGMASSLSEGGIGFDYRLAMGTPDYWIKIIKEKQDQDWNVEEIFYELTNRRNDEKVVNYAESHDQALVGDKTIIFRLIDAAMYTDMRKDSQNLLVDRGMALHKMIRLITMSTAGHSYLNFMGNEFGHPEWIDFPREGNDWSYHYARRQWSLRDNQELRYSSLGDFDKAAIHMMSEHDAFQAPQPHLLICDVERQVLVFKRESLIFAFNFNPGESFADFPVELEEADYKIVLNSDSGQFGGFDRIDESIAIPALPRSVIPYETCEVKLYLPTRSCIVLAKSS